MKNDSGAVWQEWNGGANIGYYERIASLAGGVLLTVFGLSRRSKGGWPAAALGAFLLQRGVTQRCPLYQLLGINTGGGEEDIFEILPVGGDDT